MSLEQSGSAAGETVHLSWRQRRDLLELIAAGLMSAVFFTAPVFLVRDALGTRPRPAPVRAEAPRPATVRMAPLESVHVLRTDVAAPVSTPELVAADPALRAVRWATPTRARRELHPMPQRLTLGRRIARLFAGNGTHTVQPFPSVPATDR